MERLLRLLLALLRGASQRDERKYEHLEQHSPTALASRAAAASQTPATLTAHCWC